MLQQILGRAEQEGGIRFPAVGAKCKLSTGRHLERVGAFPCLLGVSRRGREAVVGRVCAKLGRGGADLATLAPS